MDHKDAAKNTEIEAQEARRRRDFDDLSNEIADRDVGRMRRFLPEENSARTQREKRKREADQLSRLVLMMQDPEYAALYRETTDLVREYAAKAATGLEYSQTALSVAGDTLKSLADKAAKLHPSGAPVFRDRDGNAVNADGLPLSPEEAASVVWPENAPSYEEYREARRAYADAQARIAAWRDYQQYLGDVQNRLEDEDNPPTADELKQIQENIKARAPEAIAKKTEYLRPDEAPQHAGTKNIEKPIV